MSIRKWWRRRKAARALMLDAQAAVTWPALFWGECPLCGHEWQEGEIIGAITTAYEPVAPLKGDPLGPGVSGWSAGDPIPSHEFLPYSRDPEQCVFMLHRSEPGEAEGVVCGGRLSEPSHHRRAVRRSPGVRVVDMLCVDRNRAEGDFTVAWAREGGVL